MGSGDPPGLQNRRAAGFPVAGAFDSHTLPPFTMDALHYAHCLRIALPEGGAQLVHSSLQTPHGFGRISLTRLHSSLSSQRSSANLLTDPNRTCMQL